MSHPQIPAFFVMKYLAGSYSPRRKQLQGGVLPAHSRLGAGAPLPASRETLDQLTVLSYCHSNTMVGDKDEENGGNAPARPWASSLGLPRPREQQVRSQDSEAVLKPDGGEGTESILQPMRPKIW